MTLSRHFGIGAIGALAFGFALTTAPGCGSDDKSTGGTGGSTSTGGSSGSTGGSSGSTGGSSGSTGGSSGSTGGAGGGAVTPAFMEVAPCSAASDYKQVTTIKSTPLLKYDPPCVQVKKGSMVEFMMTFAVHPLKKSTMRGDVANNPIMDTATGESAKFTFAKTGFFGFFCNIHGGTDNGNNMAGVVWVTD